MATVFHKYRKEDQIKICSFYEALYNYDNYLYGYLKVMWQCIQQYPSYPMFHYEESGIWEDRNRVVGMVHLSGPGLGEVSIDIHPGYMDLFEEMVSYAEQKFSGTNRDGKKYIKTIWNQTIQEAGIIFRKHHFIKCGNGKLFYKDVGEYMDRTNVPNGFKAVSLEKVYNFSQLSRLIWDAFNYPGEPPCFHDDIFLPIKQAWFQYQRDICTVVLNQEKEYAAFCGVWFDQNTKVAYIEPLVSGRQYKNEGLGKICIYETVKKCRKIGADTIFAVPNEQNYGFYKKMGFQQQLKQESWLKIWNVH